MPLRPLSLLAAVAALMLSGAVAASDATQLILRMDKVVDAQASVAEKLRAATPAAGAEISGGGLGPAVQSWLNLTSERRALDRQFGDLTSEAATLIEDGGVIVNDGVDVNLAKIEDLTRARDQIDARMEELEGADDATSFDEWEKLERRRDALDRRIAKLTHETALMTDSADDVDDVESPPAETPPQVVETPPNRPARRPGVDLTEIRKRAEFEFFAAWDELAYNIGHDMAGAAHGREADAVQPKDTLESERLQAKYGWMFYPGGEPTEELRQAMGDALLQTILDGADEAAMRRFAATWIEAHGGDGGKASWVPDDRIQAALLSAQALDDAPETIKRLVAQAEYGLGLALRATSGELAAQADSLIRELGKIPDPKNARDPLNLTGDPVADGVLNVWAERNGRTVAERGGDDLTPGQRELIGNVERAVEEYIRSETSGSSLIDNVQRAVDEDGRRLAQEQRFVDSVSDAVRNYYEPLDAGGLTQERILDAMNTGGPVHLTGDSAVDAALERWAADNGRDVVGGE